jgi:hypothetical protein
MSTTTLTYPNDIPVRRASAIGPILILVSLTLLTGTILGSVSSITRDSFAVDNIPSAQNSIVPVPVPTPSTEVIQPTPSGTPGPSSILASDPNIVAVPVPTPPPQ